MTQPPSLVRFLQAAFFSGAITTTAALMSSPFIPVAQAAFQDSPKAVLDEAWQIVNRDYVDGSFNQVDWQSARQELLKGSYTSTQSAYTALRQQLERLGDPYTRFMDPRQYQSLTNQTSGELSGVGIRLQVDPATQILTVVSPLENSPASTAGIKTGDQIVAIDGKTTAGMTVEDASKLIQGEAGTPITLKIGREGKTPFDLPLVRARIEVPNVHSSVRQEGNAKVGYIRLTEFSSHAPDQMRRAIQGLLDQNVNAFVLDLRGNPGGLLSASVEISRMWIDNGKIVQTIDREGDSQDIAANHTALTPLPLAVLVDGNSASSSEILTGALLDNRRAVVVGTQTFGKALVQSVHPLSDGSGLAVTIAHYYTPNGTDISHRGITPTIEVGLTEQQQQTLSGNQTLIGTNADPQYAKAVNALRSTVAINQTPSGTVRQ
ncbi:MAG: S41 family peptidase [Drouetiella hepatica Uher 2000/2452]|jgi:carboxyl-terminal processing protease|uniref:S41 family peptidase n=1 Tax=Drouetiella hepatica Uher 2000/2452 TaxID=904376 RepID=A0A951Q7I6_9CYAN|nr:S41 family peptidase [Drouetiella hepatica Uher 2000/2452]